MTFSNPNAPRAAATAIALFAATAPAIADTARALDPCAGNAAHTELTEQPARDDLNHREKLLAQLLQLEQKLADLRQQKADLKATETRGDLQDPFPAERANALWRLNHGFRVTFDLIREKRKQISVLQDETNALEQSAEDLSGVSGTHRSRS